MVYSLVAASPYIFSTSVMNKLRLILTLAIDDYSIDSNKANDVRDDTSMV